MYNITKKQFITVWIFGIIFWLQSMIMSIENGSELWSALILIVPAVLIFYTIGWYSNNRKK